MSRRTQEKKRLRWHVVGRNTQRSYAAFAYESDARKMAARMEREEHVPKGTYEVVEETKG
jgi:hypothetical protein